MNNIYLVCGDDMEFPKRTHPRLKDYDYSQNGYYYVTINTEKNLPILCSVGRGLAPAVDIITLTHIGKIANEQLIELEKRYDNVKIDKYVIMPTHIHVIIVIENNTAGASPRPTLANVICAYKSLTTRLCNIADNTTGRKICQTSFYDKIIRNERGYIEVCKYIDENPAKWADDRYFVE